MYTYLILTYIYIYITTYRLKLYYTPSLFSYIKKYFELLLHSQLTSTFANTIDNELFKVVKIF